MGKKELYMKTELFIKVSIQMDYIKGLGNSREQNGDIYEVN